MALPFTHLVSKPISQATRATAAAFCVVVISGMPRATKSLVLMPSPRSITAAWSFLARPSFATRALETALARGLVSWTCILVSTSTTSAFPSHALIAKAIASARVMPLFLVAIGPLQSAPLWGYLFSRPCGAGNGIESDIRFSRFARSRTRGDASSACTSAPAWASRVRGDPLDNYYYTLIYLFCNREFSSVQKL